MTANSSKGLLLLKTQVKDTEELFEETQPEASEWLKQHEISINSIRQEFGKSVGQKIAGEINRRNSPGAINISEDEQMAIIEKLKTIAGLPPGQLDSTDALYLEQQLTDMMGIEVISKLDGHVLPHNYGMIASGSHTKRYPADKLELHKNIIEAGLDDRRQDFGWLKIGSSQDLGDSNSSNDEEQEMYSLSVQLQNQSEWQKNRSEIKKWYKNRKVIVINPFDNKAVVAAITGTGPSLSSRRQFLGSPELIRETEAWSRNAQGKVIVLFVGESGRKLPLGPVLLSRVDSSLSTRS